MDGRAQIFLRLTLLLTGLVLGAVQTVAHELHSTPLGTISDRSKIEVAADYDGDSKNLVRVSGANPGGSFLFDAAALRALGTIKIRTDYPKGRREHVYEGPLLKDVLAAAGVSGKTVTIDALDGFRVKLAIEELVSRGAVLAFKRDGRMFRIGDFGPTQIVFPRTERADLSDMSDEYWLWSVFHIFVE